MTRSDPTDRRRVLASLGTGLAAAAAGCLGGNGLGGQPTYEEGRVTVSNATSRNATQMSTAAALAQQQPTNSVTPLDSLELRTHEFVVEDGYLARRSKERSRIRDPIESNSSKYERASTTTPTPSSGATSPAPATSTGTRRGRFRSSSSSHRRTSPATISPFWEPLRDRCERRPSDCERRERRPERSDQSVAASWSSSATPS